MNGRLLVSYRPPLSVETTILLSQQFYTTWAPEGVAQRCTPQLAAAGESVKASQVASESEYPRL